MWGNLNANRGGPFVKEFFVKWRKTSWVVYIWNIKRVVKETVFVKLQRKWMISVCELTCVFLF